MSRRWIRLMMVAALLCSMGAHLPVLQAAAWVRMTMKFSRTDPLSASIAKTFDGRHPCALCLKVKNASQTGESLGASRMNHSQDALLTSFRPRIMKIGTLQAIPSRSIPPYTCILSLDSPPPENSLS